MCLPPTPNPTHSHTYTHMCLWVLCAAAKKLKKREASGHPALLPPRADQTTDAPRKITSGVIYSDAAPPCCFQAFMHACLLCVLLFGGGGVPQWYHICYGCTPQCTNAHRP
jgi:hypothetical protein